MRSYVSVWFILVSIAFLLIPAWGAVAVAAPSLDVSGGAPPVAYRQAAKGQVDAVNFTVTPSTGWFPGEGTPPGITYEEVDISADSSTTIAGVTASVPGGVWHPANNGGEYIFDESCPAAPFQLTVGASSNAVGTHNVTADGTTITLSDGESGSGTPCTESFQVVLIAVHISGPPNVIYDNGQGTFTPVYGGPGIYNPPPHVHSEYSATASGGSGSYNWDWVLPANVAFASYYYDTSEPTKVYGTAGGHPGTPEEIICQAQDNTDLTYGENNIKINLEEEYWTDWTSESDGAPPGATPALVGGQVPAPAGQGTTVTVSSGQSVSTQVGVTVTGDIPATDLGLEVGYSQTQETDGSTSAVVKCEAMPTAQKWNGCLVPMVFTLNGIGKELGPDGIVTTDAIKKVKAAPPQYDAECLTDNNALATPDTPLPVTPVQPW